MENAIRANNTPWPWVEAWPFITQPGPTPAAQWLSAYGARYGLCQIYDNEPWHYELRPDARFYGCPARYADPSQWLQ